MTNADQNWTVITGSTGGIGSEIAKQLASRGDAMVWINRSESKASALRARFAAEYPGVEVQLVTADLSESDQIEEAIKKIASLPGRVVALYNNSGILTGEKVSTTRGFELHFAVNSLAPHQLIRGLQSKMARPAGEPAAMVVNFSSSVIGRAKSLDFDQLVDPDDVGGLMGAYAQTKLAVTALAAALSDELARENILIRAIDPGATKTPMTTGGNSGMPRILAWIAPFLFRPAHVQAAKVVKSADPKAHNAWTGILVANGKVLDLPKSVADRKTQEELVSLLDRFLEPVSR